MQKLQTEYHRHKTMLYWSYLIFSENVIYFAQHVTAHMMGNYYIRKEGYSIPTKVLLRHPLGYNPQLLGATRQFLLFDTVHSTLPDLLVNSITPSRLNHLLKVLGAAELGICLLVAYWQALGILKSHRTFIY